MCCVFKVNKILRDRKKVNPSETMSVFIKIEDWQNVIGRSLTNGQLLKWLDIKKVSKL